MGTGYKINQHGEIWVITSDGEEICIEDGVDGYEDLEKALDDAKAIRLKDKPYKKALEEASQ